MKKTIITICLNLFFCFCWTQNDGIRILEENSKTHYTIRGYNPMEDPIEITFELKDVSGLNYDGVPVVLLIQPKDTLQILKLEKSGSGIGFLMDYHQMLIPKKRYDPEAFKRYEKGIVIFSKDGCARCNYTTNLLIDKNVDFTLLNFSQNEAYLEYMWDKLEAQGVTSKQVQTPIIMVDGVLSHSHENLRKTVKELTNY